MGYINKTDINALFHVKSYFNVLTEFVGLGSVFKNLFNKPEDIITYLESLHRKIQRDKLSVITSPEEEEKGDHVVMMAIMEDLASEVDAIWAKDGARGAIDVISLYGGVYNMDTGEFDVIPNSMLDRAVRKYREVPGYDYNLLASEFITGIRGLMEMITKEYNAKHKKQKDSETTEKEATLSMFLNKYWLQRIKKLATDVLKEDFTPTIDKKTESMIDEDGALDFDFFIDNQIDLQLATVLGVEERLKEKIREAVEKTFGTKLPPVTSLRFKTVVNEAVRAELNNVIREIMGGRSSIKFKAFLESNYIDKDGNVIEVWKAIYDAIPQSVLNKSFQEFIEPILDEQGRQLRPDNNRLFKRKDITKEEFIAYFFKIVNGKLVQMKSGTRKTSLINALAVTLSRHYVIDHLEDSKNLEKTENIGELQGHQKVDNYLARVTEALDLNPNNKLSITDLNLSSDLQNELNKLRDFVNKNGETKGSDMAPLLDEYLNDIDEKFKPFMGDIIENTKTIFEKSGAITMAELAKAIDSKFGQKMGFEFFDNWNQFLRDVTNGEVKAMDLTTEEGEKKFFDLMGEFSSTMDPRFLELKSIIAFFSVPGNRFKGFSSGQKNYSREFVLDKLIRNSEVTDFVRYNEKTKKFEVIVDGKLKGGLTDSEQKAIGEMVIAWNKDMSIEHDSAVEIAKLTKKINDKFNLNERRDDVEFTRDYMYSKLNDFVNQHPDGSVERLEAISFAVKILQNQTSSTHGISRAGAFLSSFTLDFSTTQKQAFRWEHNIQLLNFNANVLKSIIDGKFDEKYETLSSKYTQTLLDKDAQVFLDGKKMPTAEFKAKYGIDYAEIEKYRGNTKGAPGFVIGMESEAMFIVALGNASRTVDLKTGLTMDVLIYNKINTKRAVDYLDGIAERIRMNTPVTRNSETVFSPINKGKIFNNKFNTDLFNDILSLLVIGEDATKKIDLLAESIKTQNASDIKDHKVINQVTEKNKVENEEQDKIDAIVKMSLAGEFNGASLFDFDGTVGESENVVIATKDGKTRTLDGVQWAEDGLRLIKEDWKMDFSDFNNVTNGVLGPLWPKLINQLIKYGSENTYILTARAPEVQKALFDFINGEIDKYNEENGTEVPHMLRKNIVGLGDSTGKAKADWIKDNLILNGFNDIYFVDDIIENVDAVQDMYDEFPEGTIKDGGKSVMVVEEQEQDDDYVDYGKYSLNESFNIIIEETTGVEARKVYSDVQAELQGKRKWYQRFNILTDPNAEDFKGLIYSLLTKGEEGERQMEWFKENLIDPYDKGIAEVEKERILLLDRYKEIIKGLPKIRKKLKSKIKRQDGKDSYLTMNNAIRVWIWTKNGIDMTNFGLSQRDIDLCLEAVNNDPDTKTFADAVRNISSGYAEPSNIWISGTIGSDIKSMTTAISREKHLETFIKNKNEIFSKQNMNKLKVIQGDDYVEALEEMLYRMHYGTNNVQGNTISRAEREFNEWVNNSVGAIMFLNMRSATLQLLSTTNFIDMKYNNPLKAAQAFASAAYWKNILFIWNSPWLKSRAEKGGRTVNEEELIEAITGSKNPISAFIALMLQAGFTPTSIADRLAICFGGASYLTNGIEYYIKLLKDKAEMAEILEDGIITVEEIEEGLEDVTGMTIEEINIKAIEMAFLDLQQKANESQQSSDPRFISSIQAGGLGRVIFAFKNTPMQYARLMKRSLQDLIKGRGNSASHIAKIAYYGAIQNFMFSALQTALFASLDDEDKEWDKKSDRVIQQMIDSILVGLGMKGAILVTVKNGVLTYLDQEKKGWNADHTYTILQFANFSPTIGSKLRKIYGAIKGKQLNADEIEAMNAWDPRNPAWSSVSNVIEAFTNLPAARINNIINNLLAVSADENDFMDNLMLLCGWNSWDIGVQTESKKIGEELDKKKENKKEKEKKEKKQIMLQEIVNKEIKEHEKEVKENKVDKKETYTCPQVNKEGQRCKIEVSLPGKKCTYHEDVPIRKDGKTAQCKKIKSKGGRCGNQTMSKSGFCPIHD
tara:strand:- start:64 stop:6081 length:6018 start_codon:yes stop_codon:yes gene_type:complete